MVFFGDVPAETFNMEEPDVISVVVPGARVERGSVDIALIIDGQRTAGPSFRYEPGRLPNR